MLSSGMTPALHERRDPAHGECHDETSVAAQDSRGSSALLVLDRARHAASAQVVQVSRARLRGSRSASISAGSSLKGDDVARSTTTCCCRRPARRPIRCCSRSRTSTTCTFGGEWLFGVSDYLEAGVGVGYYQTHRAERLPRLSSTPNGAEIEQDLKLRMVPITAPCASCRSAAARRSSPTSAAASASSTGATREIGEFVDSSDDTIFGATLQRRRHRGRPGHPRRRPLPGRRRVDGRRRSALAEGRRRHRARSRAGFLGDKIDLGGSRLQLHDALPVLNVDECDVRRFMNVTHGPACHLVNLRLSLAR